MKVSRRTLALSELEHYPGNARTHDLEAIAESLERNGQYRPLIVQASRMRVIAGNGTLEAARDLGWKRIRCELVDVDDAHARRILLVDNRTNDLADYDDHALGDLLLAAEDEDGLLGTGFDEHALLQLIARDGATDPDEVPELPAKPSTRPGDVYELGDHRLLCGDATKPEDVRRVVGEALAQMLWTDPPYGVDYVGGTKARKRIRNDHAAGLTALLEAAFAGADTALEPGAAIYVAHPAGSHSLVFGNCFSAQGWRLHQELVWVKDAMVLGRSDYHYRHEGVSYGGKDGADPLEPDRDELEGDHEHVPILYGYTAGGGRRGRGTDHWWGDNRQTSVLYVPRPKASREHPTMKPVQLVEIALRNSSHHGHTVLDPFAGSGSTLVACERLERRARCIELDPAYCDVIVERWKQHTGGKAKRQRRRG